MAYQIHFSPIDYLQRRIVYYKKLRGKMTNCLKDGFMLKKYGKEELEKMIAKRIKQIDLMIEEYNYAIQKLKSNE
jgi:prefoldin subunit 5